MLAKLKFILGKKLGMTQIFSDDGIVIPVTLIKAEPLEVTLLKTKEKDGYEAVQVGTIIEGKSKKEKEKKRRLKEFRVKGEIKRKIGDRIDVSVFQKGDTVKISGFSKGKGFQGVVKRHGFAGYPASHGHKHGGKRRPGSIGQRFPQHTLKGTRMGGHMGAQRVTIRGLEVVKVDKDEDIIAIKGAVPGRRGTILEIVGEE